MNFLFKILLCFSLFSTEKNREKEMQEFLRYEIITAFDKKQEATGYEFGSRAVFAPDKFKGYMLSYYGFKNITQDEARKLLVTNVEALLTALNSEDRLVGSFYKHPLTNEDVQILYANYESKNVEAKAPYVYAVSNHHDVVTFRFSKPDHPNDYQIIDEPYDEAYQKVFGHPRAGK